MRARRAFIMDKTQKIPNEITVRISLGFQDSPEVHTLLSMTPVRQRGKLVRQALEIYIAETNHPAGKPETQLQAIALWLTQRAEASNGIPAKTEYVPDNANCIKRIDQEVAVPVPRRSNPVSDCPATSVHSSGKAGDSALAPDTTSSGSLGRWLNT
jgi:hypothetical protein